MRVLSAIIFAITCCLIVQTTVARAELSAPTISHAIFDAAGRLRVRTTHSGYQGCYLGVYGGLKADKVDTLIIARQLTANQASSGKLNFATKRRYFCKRRTLYVDVELVCLGDEVGQFTSAVTSVTVPNSNIRR